MRLFDRYDNINGRIQNTFTEEECMLKHENLSAEGTNTIVLSTLKSIDLVSYIMLYRFANLSQLNKYLLERNRIFVCLVVCLLLNYSKTTNSIELKFYGKLLGQVLSYQFWGFEIHFLETEKFQFCRI